jgi:hypothetical protein
MRARKLELDWKMFAGCSNFDLSIDQSGGEDLRFWRKEIAKLLHSSHFPNWSFSQLVIFPIGHFPNWSFSQFLDKRLYFEMGEASRMLQCSGSPLDIPAAGGTLFTWILQGGRPGCKSSPGVDY